MPEETDREGAMPIEDWNALTLMVLRMFEHWQISDADIVGLLGLPATDENALERFRSGEMIGAESDVKERVGLLLSIHSRLRILFPRNRDLAYRWPTTPISSLGGKTPVAVAQ